MKLQHQHVIFKDQSCQVVKLSRFTQMKSSKKWHGLTIGTYTILWMSCNSLVVCLDRWATYVLFLYYVCV